MTTLLQSVRAACLLLAFVLSLALGMPAAQAEQKQIFGEYEVHYILLPTVSLNAKIADQYGITRAQDRALVNVSVLGGDGKAVLSKVSGVSTNLLGQPQTLRFDEVREGDAIYYLSLLRHADEEHHRVVLEVVLPDGNTAEVRFQQLMYWER